MTEDTEDAPVLRTQRMYGGDYIPRDAFTLRDMARAEDLRNRSIAAEPVPEVTPVIGVVAWVRRLQETNAPQ